MDGIPRVNKCTYCGLATHAKENCWQRLYHEMGIDASKGGSICLYCGLRGHGERTCVKKMRDDARNRNRDNKGPNVPMRTGANAVELGGERQRVNQNEPVPSTSSGFAGTEIERTRMLTPIKVDNIRFPECLVDTGSEVNLIPLKDVKENGLIVSPGRIQAIKAFDGRRAEILGTISGKLQFGPKQDGGMAEFLVSGGITQPVIGLPTLKDFGFSVDCVNHSLNNVDTGEMVRCSAVEPLPKN